MKYTWDIPIISIKQRLKKDCQNLCYRNPSLIYHDWLKMYVWVYLKLNPWYPKKLLGQDLKRKNVYLIIKKADKMRLENWLFKEKTSLLMDKYLRVIITENKFEC